MSQGRSPYDPASQGPQVHDRRAREISRGSAGHIVEVEVEDPYEVMSPWYVVLTEPQQEYPSVWRCHLLGLELFSPVIRRRIKTGRIHNGRAITRLVARPMFPSYGFIRQSDARNLASILAVRGVRDFLRNERNQLVTLPHDAVLAVYAKQQEELDGFITSERARLRGHNFAAGDWVRVADNGVYSGLVATVNRIGRHGRIEVLFGMIRHSMPAEMVEAVA
jgi:transcription antitermination factor NusG